MHLKYIFWRNELIFKEQFWNRKERTALEQQNNTKTITSAAYEYSLPL